MNETKTSVPMFLGFILGCVFTGVFQLTSDDDGNYVNTQENLLYYCARIYPTDRIPNAAWGCFPKWLVK